MSRDGVPKTMAGSNVPQDEMPPTDMTPAVQNDPNHPYWQDLNPDFLAGENHGELGPHPERTARTAYDVKGAHRRLQSMNDEDLKQIPILPPGSRLEQGGTYIDLRAPEPVEFTATGNLEASQANWYVPKSDVPYWIWNRLIGVESPERLDMPQRG
jgi:hypothetical protein